MNSGVQPKTKCSQLLWVLGFEGVLRLFLGHLMNRVARGDLTANEAALLETFGNKVGRLADEAARANG